MLPSAAREKAAIVVLAAVISGLPLGIIQESQNAIDIDHAEAIVLGCTGMLDVAKEVGQVLAELGKPAPVIDPTTTAIAFLQLLIRN